MSKKFWAILGFGIAAVIAVPVILGLLYFMLWSLVMNNGRNYRGDHPELYTVAVNSFLGCAGHSSNGEISFSAETGILETDDYGRILFYYHEGTIVNGCGYGILQKAQDDYAYFYEDDSVICAIDDWNGRGDQTHDEWFTQEEIDAFKTLNDWGQPLNETKCTKKAIVTRKPDSKIKPTKEDFNKAAKAYFAENGIAYTEKSVYGSDVFFISDDYGREIHYLRCYIRGVVNPDEYYLALIFNPDGTFSGSAAAAVIEDPLNYHEVLKELKQNNGWNTEYQAG